MKAYTLTTRFSSKATYTYILLFLFGIVINAKSQVVIDTFAAKDNGVWYTKNNVLPDPNPPQQDPPSVQGIPATLANIKTYAPFTKGVFATLTWRSLCDSFSNSAKSPVYNWHDLDSALQSFSDSNLLIILMVWAGPDCPDWLIDPAIMKVPQVNFINDPTVYPYYFYRATSTLNGYYKKNDTVYKVYWYKMLDTLNKHILAYGGNASKDKLRKSIVIVQSAEGSTGDEGPYGGHTKDTEYVNIAYKINRNDAAWFSLRQNAWKHLDSLYSTITDYTKQIHVLVNCDPDDLEDGGWMRINLPNVWRKTNGVGHVYQYNNEVDKKALFKPFIDSLFNTYPGKDSGITRFRSRDEMDRYGDSLQSRAPRWYNFYGAASALYFPLDIWPNTATGLLDSGNYKKGFDFFAKYAGHRKPQTAPGGFCVLREGLDASDTVRFPKGLTYGTGTSAKGDTAGENRCVKIANSFKANYGASQDDKIHGQGDLIWNLNATQMNDVGWNIYDSNYERFVTQIYVPTDTTKNGQGYWRIGNKSTEWYGRFCKGFRHSSNKDSMFFKVATGITPDTPPDSCKLHIVYYDTIVPTCGAAGAVSWKVVYDATNGATADLISVKNGTTNKWVDLYVDITRAKFHHSGPHGSDIILVNVDACPEMFAMVEIIKTQ